jgi:hypothetical protein
MELIRPQSTYFVFNPYLISGAKVWREMNGLTVFVFFNIIFSVFIPDVSQYFKKKIIDC